MDISFSNELCYMSASSSSQEMFFYSVPTSPNRLKLLREHHGSQTGPTTPRSYEDANSNLDGFEFETSRRFIHSQLNQRDVKLADHQQEQKQRLYGEASLPTMAFADELFCEGKVMPMIVPPLKLPPRLVQNGDGNIMSTQSSTLTSPKSPGSLLRLPFSRLWNDDFDPFTVALEKVREEKRVKSKGSKHGLRRSRSLSPFRDFNKKSDKHVGPSELHQPESHWCDTAQLLCELQGEALKKGSERKNMISEPKGLVFARQVRQVRVANDENFEPKRTIASKVAKETKKDESQRGGFWTRNKMKESIKKFFFGNAKMSKASTQHKLEDKKAAPGKPTLLKKLDMKSVSSTESTLGNNDETTGELNKMRLVCHRPLPKFLSAWVMRDGKGSD